MIKKYLNNKINSMLAIIICLYSSYQPFLRELKQIKNIQYL